MPRSREILPIVVSLVLFLILEGAGFVMLRKSSTLQGLWVSRVAHHFMANVWGANQQMGRYFSLKKENDRLAADNHELLVRLQASQKALSDLTGEQRARELQQSQAFSYLPASIVKISRNRQHNYFIIDKGSEDGVDARSAIITHQGAVGIVDAVHRHYAYVLSFQNAEVSVSARLGTEGAMGPLVWDGHSADGALLKEIPLHFKFEKGDTVYTSGFSSVFPPDIPLGVTGDSRIVNGAMHEIKVTLFQDYSALRHVTVVENRGRDEIDILGNE